MGWNSWDSYGLTINEAQFKANARVLAELRQYGWQYAVIDEGWYMADPTGSTVAAKKYLWNKNGLLIPAPDRFPSAASGAGFKPLADWVHAHGLKFGIHIVRGIPRQVTAENLPIAGTKYTAAEAADKTSPCPWDEGNWGVKDNAAGQAYYDSMMKMYAAWGVDFIKVDCISDRPYRLTEIRQIAEAIRKTGRPILLSLSPGPTALGHAAKVARYAQMWRISDDHWDGWSFPHPHGGDFPSGILQAFDLLAEWFPYAGPGHWPDADMLPEGWLGPSPGFGPPRESRETHEEERTEFSLWAIARSPLILGANLTRLDSFTRALITNQNVIFVNQNATYSRPVSTAGLGPAFAHVRIWRATIKQPGERGYAEYFGFFNLDSKPAALRATWKQLGLNGGRHSTVNAWDGSTGEASKRIAVALPAHGCEVFQVR